MIDTSGNVVRGSQSYANRMGASGYCLQTVNKCIIMLFTKYTERKSAIGQCGSEYFSFLYKIEEKQSWKNKRPTFNLIFLAEANLSHCTSLRIN